MSPTESPEDLSRIGRFEVRRVLGTGGMGVVYAALDTELDREVAVKLLRRRVVDTNSLMREAKAMAKLSHPNVATVYQVGTHEGAPYVVMELVDGQSMYDWMHEMARPWREVLSMFFHAGLGLAAAHAAGIVHRDFKPSNVLIGTDHRPRVVDFGLARPAEWRGGLPVTLDTDEVESTNPSLVDGKISDVITTAPSMVDGKIGDVAKTAESVVDGSIADVAKTTESVVDGRIADVTTTAGSMVDGRVDMARTAESVLDGRIEDVLRTASATLNEARISDVMGDSESTISDVLATAQGDMMATVPPGVTSTGVVAGTPAYMAPELFVGVPSDERGDQFAYCVALHEGLYGERPFAGDTAAAIAENVLRHNISEPPDRTRVPGWLRNIIVRGLAVLPGERHPSMKSLLASIAFTARIMPD